MDDEADIVDFVQYNLSKSYDVITASNGQEGFNKWKEYNPDLILLDVMMPIQNGLETCEKIRNTKNIQQPVIIFLSALSQEIDQIKAYELGANDYLTKPFSIKILIKKIEQFLHNKVESNQDSFQKNIIEIGDFVIDKVQFLVRKGEMEIRLPRKEFNLLYLLASKPNEVVLREEIMQKIWGDEVIVGERTIDVHIRKIREKLSGEYIQTVKGIGYKFVFH